MTMYDFDKIINRKNTGSLKYDFCIERNKQEDLIPLWVADMDFRLPQEILDDIHTAVEHGIFGYTEPMNDYFDTVINWFDKRHSWKIEKEWFVCTPSVVVALAQAIKAYTNESDSVLIQPPVYYPFFEIVKDNNRKMIQNELIYDGDKYHIDFEDFENKIIENNVKLFLLCSPHNPVSRVWTIEELKRIGDICLKHNVIVVADEIHCDFVYKGHKYIPFASISKDFENNTIVCTSPSKSFNIAGLQIANIFIANKNLRNRFISEVNKSGYSQINTIGSVAGRVVYEKGEDWLKKLVEYLQGNIDFIENFLGNNLPQLKMIKPEGTYLVWIDFSKLGKTYKELEDLIVNKAKLWLDAGVIFGGNSEQFERINIACPRQTLEKALNQLKFAIDESI